MIVKQEDFDTKEGNGFKIILGPFFNVNSKSSEKLYYEIVLFSQKDYNKS
jgi:hypothetical protein